ncbi:NADH-quinone oxidoreductase subunit N [Bienertia sinuspersici]
MASELTVETSPQTQKSSKVMVAIDGGEYGNYALKWALQNLDENSNMVFFFLLLFLVITVGFLLEAIALFVTVDLLASIQDNQKKCADSILAKAKEICAKQGV